MGFIKAPRKQKTAKPATAVAAQPPTRLVTAAAPTGGAQPVVQTPTAPDAVSGVSAWWVPDVTFIVENRVLQAHKVVLASRSEHFNQLFSTQPAAQYEITEVSYEAMSLFIRWAYAGSRDVPASGAVDLLRCAVAFNVPDLRDICETALTVLSETAPDPAFNVWSNDPVLARTSGGPSPLPSSPIGSVLHLQPDFGTGSFDPMMDISA